MKARFFCPCCGRFHSGFKPGGARSAILAELRVIGGGYRKSRKCPICFCLDRERLVYLFLTSLATILDGKKILHIAPESHVRKLLEDKSPTSYFSGSLHFRLNTPKMDIMKIPFSNDFFHLIVCNHVLEHIPYDRLAMAEIFRVLKPGGLAILQVPISSKIEKSCENAEMNTSDLRAEAFGQRDHVRIYAKTDYISRLQAVGFVMQVINFSHGKNPVFAKQHGINSAEELYIGCKATLARQLQACVPALP